MPDLSLNPADLIASSSSVASSIPSKLNVAAAQSAQKASKASNAAPRVDLEPLYTNLKVTIAEHWAEYKEAISLFVLGHINQEELCQRTDYFLCGDPNVEHLHNQLVAGVLTNAGREAPEPGVAPWVSSNDKPVTVAKPVSGDVAEQRLKTEVMQLPARDRRRLKDVSEPEAQDPVAQLTAEYYLAKQFRSSEAAPATASGKTNWDLEIRKRYDQPLAAETGEFPDAETIQKRMVPICYEESLPQGCAPSCAGFMATATEHFIKEVLSTVYNRTRVNMTGGSVNSVLTHRFRHRLLDEEDALSRGSIARDPGTGLLPIEAREAAVRPGLGIHDLRLALDVGNSALGQFPAVTAKVIQGYSEGEYESSQDRRKRNAAARQDEEKQEKARRERWRASLDADGDVRMNGTNGVNGAGPVVNGVAAHNYAVDDDVDEAADWGWAGGSVSSRAILGNALDECLAIGS